MSTLSNDFVHVYYHLWDENLGKVTDYEIDSATVAKEEIFLRKLVNATVIGNVLYDHTSNETEDGVSNIYVQPYTSQTYFHQKAVEDATFGAFDIADKYTLDFYILDDLYKASFMRTTSLPSALECAYEILDHYKLIQGVSYELVYTVLDPARKKVLVFLQEASVA